MISAVGGTPQGLPPALPASAMPREVRQGSAEDQKAFRSALGFERALLGELTKALKDSATPADGGSGAMAQHGELLGDTMADALVANGGIGLARTMYRDLRDPSA